MQPVDPHFEHLEGALAGHADRIILPRFADGGVGVIPQLRLPGEGFAALPGDFLKQDHIGFSAAQPVRGLLNPLGAVEADQYIVTDHSGEFVRGGGRECDTGAQRHQQSFELHKITSLLFCCCD